MYNVQLKKDLEGFLNELDKINGLDKDLSEKQLLGNLTPKIEEYFEQYNNQFYNAEKIDQVKNNLLQGLYAYV
ncbi:hypothetical protein COV11_02180, partial [Candidatus Woesearchaeota archaeon CG10_big_fil_rev_8_21_14_0_10_30_7]